MIPANLAKDMTVDNVAVSGFRLRKQVQELLCREDFFSELSRWSLFSARRVINPLLSFLYSPDETIKWRAVTAVGVVMARLADEEMEAARNVMRRFIWSLNDESGGIGWGAPEAMGECMARHARLAEEYWCILFSYICPDGNLLENGLLERGVLWGLGRLAQVRPELLREAPPYLLPYLGSTDPVQRGYAAWALGFMQSESLAVWLEGLKSDAAEISLLEDGCLLRLQISEVTEHALVRASERSRIVKL